MTKIVTDDWRSMALQLYMGGVGPADIKSTLEEMYGVSLEYNYLKCWLYKQRKKAVKKAEKILSAMSHGDIPTSHGLKDLTIDEIRDLGKPEPKRVMVQNQEPNVIDTKWDGCEVIKFALMGDTQLGSKYTQLTHLHAFYDICAKEGIKDVYHVGDITEGLKMRVGHEYELYAVSADDMRDDVIKNYPMREGITTHFITGNHDASIYKQVGYDIGRAIANARPDMKYLGKDCAVINLTPNCTLELRHPWDGTAYALSYKPQKMIEAMESDSKPNILAIGHYHKAEYIFYRNVHCLQTGCFQSQTPFTRGKGISIHMGGWIVTIRVDKNGTIQGIAPEFVPFYSSIKDDWKNFKN